MNEEPLLSYERIRFGKQTRFNPIRTLTPESLSFNLDQFAYGYLRWTALMWDAMERRDDVLKCVVPKRKKAPGRRPWKVMTKDDSATAKQHKATLDYFYNNLTATNGIDRNVKGGVRQLLWQMMDAHSKYYSVHNIVWKPSTAGLTAELFFIPLWYFENLTGELRFLLQDFDVEGQPLVPGDWMVTAGDGLMEASSIAYMFKHLPLKDWLFYSQRHGMPGIQGKTDAAPGSEAWNIMREAVGGFGQNFSCVTGKTDEIEKIDMSAEGQLPFPPLIERIDRALSSLWRGADLSSMSGHGGSHGGGQGASLQGQESELLEADDCELLSETLQEQLDKWVIWYQHGTDEPMAYFTIEKPTDKDTDQDLAVDTFLLDANFPLAVADVAERYDRRIPAEGEELLQTPQMPVEEPGGAEQGASNVRAARLRRRRIAMNAVHGPAGLSTFLDSVKKRITAANAVAWKPMIDRLTEIDQAPEDKFFELVGKLVPDIPALLKPTGADQAAINAWQDSLGTALCNGLTQK